MGNTVVVPSYHDWYTQLIKKQKITLLNHLDAGQFFLVFEGKNSQNQDIIIKAYEYNEPLQKLEKIKYSKRYFKKLSDHSAEVPGIVNFTYYMQDNMAFLFRPKFEKSFNFVEFCSYQQPILEPIEKLFIFYQLYSIIKSLHSIGLAHGDLKPSNIFVNGHDLDLCIVDPAPFKPDFILESSLHIFYHYFTTSSDSGCYLAPERIIGIIQNDQSKSYPHQKNSKKINDNTNQNKETESHKEKGRGKEGNDTYHPKNNSAHDDSSTNENVPNNTSHIDMKMADIFSFGCIIAFLYLNGEHIFDLSKLHKYANGKIDIRKDLAPIEDENIIDIIMGLISLDVEERRDTMNQLDHIFEYFFAIFSKLFIEYRNDQLFKSQPQEHIPKFIKIIHDLFENGRLLLFNFFFDQLLKMDQIQSIIYSVQEITKFITYTKITKEETNTKLDTENNSSPTKTIQNPFKSVQYPENGGISAAIKMTRVIPLFLTTIRNNTGSPLVFRQCLFSILDILKTIDQFPPLFKDYINGYLKFEFDKLITLNKGPRLLPILANIAPFYVYRLRRFVSDDSLLPLSSSFSGIFGQGITPYVFSIFAHSMITVAHIIRRNNEAISKKFKEKKSLAKKEKVHKDKKKDKKDDEHDEKHHKDKKKAKDKEKADDEEGVKHHKDKKKEKTDDEEVEKHHKEKKKEKTDDEDGEKHHKDKKKEKTDDEEVEKLHKDKKKEKTSDEEGVKHHKEKKKEKTDDEDGEKHHKDKKKEKTDDEEVEKLHKDKKKEKTSDEEGVKHHKDKKKEKTDDEDGEKLRKDKKKTKNKEKTDDEGKTDDEKEEKHHKAKKKDKEKEKTDDEAINDDEKDEKSHKIKKKAKDKTDDEAINDDEKDEKSHKAKKKAKAKDKTDDEAINDDEKDEKSHKAKKKAKARDKTDDEAINDDEKDEKSHKAKKKDKEKTDDDEKDEKSHKSKHKDKTDDEEKDEKSHKAKKKSKNNDKTDDEENNDDEHDDNDKTQKAKKKSKDKTDDEEKDEKSHKAKKKDKEKHHDKEDDEDTKKAKGKIKKKTKDEKDKKKEKKKDKDKKKKKSKDKDKEKKKKEDEYDDIYSDDDFEDIEEPHEPNKENKNENENEYETIDYDTQYFDSGFSIFNSFFFYILSVYNYNEVYYKKEALKIILEFYKCSKYNIEDKKKYHQIFSDSLFPILAHILSKEISFIKENNNDGKESNKEETELVVEIFDFLKCLCDSSKKIYSLQEAPLDPMDMFSYSLGYQFYNIALDYYKKTTDSSVRYNSYQFMKTLSIQIKDFIFYETFLSDSSSPSKRVLNNSNNLSFKKRVSYMNNGEFWSFQSNSKLINSNKIKQQPLITSNSYGVQIVKNKKPFFSPRFIASFHAETIPISHVLCTSGLCVVIDKSNRVRWISLPQILERQMKDDAMKNNIDINFNFLFHNERFVNNVQQLSQIRSTMLREKVTAASIMPRYSAPFNSTSFLLGYDNGSIDQHDLSTCQKSRIFDGFNRVFLTSRSSNMSRDSISVPSLNSTTMINSVIMNSPILNSSVLNNNNSPSNSNQSLLPDSDFVSDSAIIAIRPISENSIVFANKRGSLRLIDTRTSDSFLSLSFDPQIGGIADICTWNGVMVAAGFQAGAISLIDTRMFQPFLFNVLRSDSLRKIVPMDSRSDQINAQNIQSHSNSSSFLVLNDENEQVAEIYREPLNKVVLTYNCPENSCDNVHKIREAVPFAGGAIAVDDISASFITLNTSCDAVKNKYDIHHSRRIYDEFVLPLNADESDDDEINLSVYIPIKSQNRTKSIHMHSGKVTCASSYHDRNTNNNGIISCDDLGFVNLWNVTSG